jgi:TetR/AcrR family transcriptional repressor of mexJK operon
MPIRGTPIRNDQVPMIEVTSEMTKTIKNPITAKPSPRRGGRPSREQASMLEDKILDAAAALFFSEGYGAASIEEIARRAQISKRTFYARFDNKAAVFSAVVHRLIQRVRPDAAAADKLFKGKSVEEILHQLAHVLLHASLSPETLSMHRVVVAEAIRFPELALIMNEQSSRQEAISRIADLLNREIGLDKSAAMFAAEQFIIMVVSMPQRRALGLGLPMSSVELDAWVHQTVNLFLHGCMAVKN